jgi:hypothetical protein
MRSLTRNRGVCGGADMPGRGRKTFKHLAFWAGASLTALVIGLAMILHEQPAHDVCAASIHNLGRSPPNLHPVCGFADTVYWAGFVILVVSAVSLIGAAKSAIPLLSRSMSTRNRPTPTTRNWSPSRETRTSVNPTTTSLPAPAAWFRPTGPAPFELPGRQPVATASVPPPAWYRDPDNPDAIRWWDGSSWGESRLNS